MEDFDVGPPMNPAFAKLKQVLEVVEVDTDVVDSVSNYIANANWSEIVGIAMFFVTMPVVLYDMVRIYNRKLGSYYTPLSYLIFKHSLFIFNERSSHSFTKMILDPYVEHPPLRYLAPVIDSLAEAIEKYEARHDEDVQDNSISNPLFNGHGSSNEIYGKKKSRLGDNRTARSNTKEDSKHVKRFKKPFMRK